MKLDLTSQGMGCQNKLNEIWIDEFPLARKVMNNQKPNRTVMGGGGALLKPINETLQQKLLQNNPRNTKC